MSILEVFLIGVGLSMDAFAVAVCRGLKMQKLNAGQTALIALFFGGFQALMPLIGYFLGVQFQSLIQDFDHWIAFVLLSLIGANMIKESRESADELNDSFGVKAMLPLAVATSIDALAVGVTFAFLQVNIVSAVSFIGVTTFILSAVGIRIGNIFGAKYKSRAELVGGIVLILMGLKILLEHLGVFEWIGTLFA